MLHVAFHLFIQSDFDNQTYVIKAPANDTPIDVSEIIRYIDNCKVEPLCIRQTVEHLSWKYQMRIVLDTVSNNSIH